MPVSNLLGDKIVRELDEVQDLARRRRSENRHESKDEEFVVTASCWCGEVTLVFRLGEYGVPMAGVTAYSADGIRLEPDAVGVLNHLRMRGPMSVDPTARAILSDLVRVILLVLEEAGYTVMMNRKE